MPDSPNAAQIKFTHLIARQTWPSAAGFVGWHLRGDDAGGDVEARHPPTLRRRPFIDTMFWCRGLLDAIQRWGPSYLAAGKTLVFSPARAGEPNRVSDGRKAHWSDGGQRGIRRLPRRYWHLAILRSALIAMKPRPRAGFAHISGKCGTSRTRWRMAQSDVNCSPASKFPDHQGKYREFLRFRAI